MLNLLSDYCEVSYDFGCACQIYLQEIHEGLEFSSNVDDYEDYSFGIFSVKFSTDGREIVAASSDDAIYVYDLEARKLSLRIAAHRVLMPSFQIMSPSIVFIKNYCILPCYFLYMSIYLEDFTDPYQNKIDM